MEPPYLWRTDFYDLSIVVTPVYNMSVYSKYQICSIVNLLRRNSYIACLISQNFNDLKIIEKFRIL